MLKQVFASALFAGLGAGVLAAALQLFFIVPLLLQGEMFESGLLVHFQLGAGDSIQTDKVAISLAAELPRHVGTVAMNLVAYIGFAFLLVTGFGLAGLKGHHLSARRGLIWGLAGFCAVQLAPAAGLPPELPGTIAAELGVRQVWWIGTVLASVAGLTLIAFAPGFRALAGVALLLLPHLIGAPHLDVFYGVAPPELAAEFAARSLAVGAASWVCLGGLAGWLWAQEG